MSEGYKAKTLAQCGKGICRIESAITEMAKPYKAIEYGGTISCGTCGKDWAYDRTEGQAAVITPLGFKMAL